MLQMQQLHSRQNSIHAATRVQVRRILAKCDYPPDLEEKAVELVLEQADLFAGNTGGQ